MEDGTPSSSTSTGSAAANREPARHAGLPGGGLAASQWPATVATGIDDVLATVHDRVIRPLLLVGRGIVFGILVASMAFVLSILVAVAAIRLLTVYAFGHRVWAADALVGGVLVLGGIAAWSKRTPKQAEGS
jgi:hypothetical protein